MNTTRIDSTTSDTYKTLSPSKKRQWRRHTKFLNSYAETRSKTLSASLAGVSYRTVMKWQSSNEFGFTERLEDADIIFCENLEQLALDRVTLLNANLPQKYRPSVVMSDDAAKDVLKELRSIAKDAPDPIPDDSSSEELSALDQVNSILSDKKGGMA